MITTSEPEEQSSLEMTRWYNKRYYGRAFEWRMQVSFGISSGIVFVGIPFSLGKIRREKLLAAERLYEQTHGPLTLSDNYFQK
eukprot:snap_masked-scaffold_1-processed-gene-31.6-mRNA-1 protein AED:1.00 eAED:1.00 QI:0/-1/0/0/-1/1/1/0/82